jgi:hypothetical protein
LIHSSFQNTIRGWLSRREHFIAIAGVKPEIANYNCGTLKKADQFRQPFPPSLCELRRAGNPKLDVAKQLRREIFRPQLAFQGKS